MSTHYGDLEEMEVHEGFNKPGITVVGQYDKMGSVLKKPLILGSQEKLAEIHERFKTEVISSGGKFIMPVEPIQPSTAAPKKRGRKPKLQPISSPVTLPAIENSTYSYELPTVPVAEEEDDAKEQEEQLVIQKRITFQNAFGKMRLEVEDVIHQDNNFSIMLVFSNDNKLTFIPKEGEHLEFSENGESPINVFFPGSLFDYKGKIVMILFRIHDNVEEKD